MEVLKVYDNGGETFDRYTVYYSEKETPTLHMCRGMSENPSHPQGFGIFSSGMLGDHNGKEITLEDLPEACQELVKYDLE